MAISITDEVLAKLLHAKNALARAKNNQAKATEQLENWQQKLDAARQDQQSAQQEYDELLAEVPTELQQLLATDGPVEIESTGLVNTQVVKKLRQLAKGKESIKIDKKTQQALAEECKCSIGDVEASIAATMEKYNPDNKRGRIVNYTLK